MISCWVSVFIFIFCFIIYISNSVAVKAANHYRAASWRCKVSYTVYAGRIHNSFRAEHKVRLGEVCCPKKLKSESIDDDLTLKKMEGKIIN